MSAFQQLKATCIDQEVGITVDTVSNEVMEEGLVELERLFRRHKITEKELDMNWKTMALFCPYQVQERKGIRGLDLLQRGGP